jgi:hypothetical protein
MPFRVSYFFVQAIGRTGGWSENYWNSNTDIEPCVRAGVKLATALRQCHGLQSNLRYMRISDAATFRDVTLVEYVGEGAQQTNGNTDSDYPTNAAGLKLVGSGNYVTRQWIKGVEDTAINDGGLWLPSGRTTRNFNAFFAILQTTSEQWVLKRLNRATPKLVVENVTNAGVVSITGHGYANNAKIRISRCRGTFFINQLWTIKRIDADSFSLIGYVPQTNNPVYRGGGTSQLQTPTYVPITNASIERATKHNVGRPFAQLTGRRRRPRNTQASLAVA